MGPPELALSELTELASAHRLSSTFGTARGEPIVIVHLGSDDALPSPDTARHELDIFPAVVVGIGSIDHPAKSFVDVLVEPERVGGDLAAVVEAVTRHPLASTALCLLLRHGDERTIAAGLVAESTTYSMLQGGPEFAAWLASRHAVRTPEIDTPAVTVELTGDSMVITLNRPSRHNAVDVDMSERLVEALTEALAEPERQIVLRGNGPSFSSGGDLAEFGSFTDPAASHAVRLSRSAGQLIAMMSDRVEAHVHGICFGAGIELPAFAGTIVAAADTRIALPEVSLGLVPGAGGTVSVPRRIGRHRTALLALTGESVDAGTAHRWGLVDHVQD
ncbi:MAG: enoyl-CoA hydratase [Ilumatobacteraceae bacterium]